jgi:hypothetical protein
MKSLKVVVATTAVTGVALLYSLFANADDRDNPVIAMAHAMTLDSVDYAIAIVKDKEPQYATELITQKRVKLVTTFKDGTELYSVDNSFIEKNMFSYFMHWPVKSVPRSGDSGFVFFFDGHSSPQNTVGFSSIATRAGCKYEELKMPIIPNGGLTQFTIDCRVNTKLDYEMAEKMNATANE